MAFGSDNDIKIVLTLDSGGVVKELRALGDELNKVGEGAKASGSDVSALQSVFSSVGGQIVVLNQAADLATRAFGALKSAGALVFDTLERGSAVADVADSFARLAEQAGTTASVFQKQLVEATGETISDFELQRKAIESLRAGIKPDEFVTLTQAARALAEQTGGSTTDSINELSTAFETGRVRGLQNKLGVLDLTRAEEQLAKQLGVTREELSAEGQVLAARNALLEASAEKIAEVGQISADAADLIGTFDRAFRNLIDQFSLAIATNESLNRALAELSALVKEADFSPLIKAFDAVVSLGGKVAQVFIDIGVAIGEFARGVGEEAIANVSEEFENLRNKLKGTEEATIGVGKEFSNFSEAVDEMIAKQEEAAKKIKEETDAKNKNGRATSDLRSRLTELVNRKEEDKEVTEASAKAVREWVKALELNSSQAVQTTFTTAQLAESMAALTQATGKTEEAFSRLTALESLAEGNFTGFIDELKKQAGQIQEAVETALADSLRAALEGGNREDYREIAKNLGGQLGSYFGPIGEVLGEKAAEAIFDGLASFFGDRNAQGKVRDSLDAFFGELLKDNPALVIFEDRLKQIFDLDFLRGSNAFTDGTFDDTLQGLSTSAIATFDGIALAFSQFVEGATEQSSQLSAILANNLGGSLNNLQLFVESTGISFEQLREKIIEAFLDGKLTADQALNSLSSVQQIAEKGIPGALGAVDQAFNNLRAAGEKGGRALVDALQDIGIEARELGVKDFATLSKIIQERTGASAEDVQKLFDSLAAAGITSIEQLEKATTEQLLPAISNLSKAEFPFEEAADSVQGLIDQVNELPDRIEKKLVFNVETRADRNSQELIDKGAIPNFGNAGEGT